MHLNGPPHVMVVDDDDAMRAFLELFLRERGHRVVAFSNANDAVKSYQSERPDVVVLDMLLPGDMDGLGALAAFKKIDRDVPIIVLSGQGRTATVVQAMKLGASDFVNKPFQPSELDAPLAVALRQRQLNSDLAALRGQLRSQSKYDMLFGDGERMAEVQDLIARVADIDVTVLIRGESGTGKELVARALCASSLRRDKPFVKVNCAALPTELLESELFGFERGAFTGAIQHKPGKFEFANRGTMFLDEIGEMSLPLQAKLLQVLQDGDFSRLGGKHDLHVDVRVVAATNKDLDEAVAEGQFREDLFFRLNVVCIHMPPLRERREEVPTLADHFLKKYSVQYNKPYVALSTETMRLLGDYHWPGNIRELENLIKRTVVLASEAPIRTEIARGTAMAAQKIHATARRQQFPDAGRQPSASDRPAPAVRTLPAVETRWSTGVAPLTPTEIASAATASGNYSLKRISRTAAREAERELIFTMLQQTRWNRKETAELLGISYKALLYKIKENELDKAAS